MVELFLILWTIFGGLGFANEFPGLLFGKDKPFAVFLGGPLVWALKVWEVLKKNLGNS